jgi:hypothetical protein
MFSTPYDLVAQAKIEPLCRDRGMHRQIGEPTLLSDVFYRFHESPACPKAAVLWRNVTGAEFVVLRHECTDPNDLAIQNGGQSDFALLTVAHVLNKGVGNRQGRPRLNYLGRIVRSGRGTDRGAVHFQESSGFVWVQLSDFLPVTQAQSGSNVHSDYAREVHLHEGISIDLFIGEATMYRKICHTRLI